MFIPSSIYLFSHHYRSAMRSLIYSSADISTIAPLMNPPIPNLVPTLPSPSRETPTPSIHPAPTANLPPFFNVEIDSLLLSPQSRRHVTHAIQNSWAKSTVKRYSSSIQQYIRFCEAEGVPNHLRFPADEFVLCAFTASSIGIHARNTPKNRLSALKAWHIAPNLEWKGSSRLQYVLNGVHNLTPRGSRRPPRPPINSKMLTQLLQHLNLKSPLDIAVAACATTAFWGQCRLGELLPSSSPTLSLSLFPTRSSLKKSSRNPQAHIIHLPRTKTHHHGQEIVLVDQCAPINPISLLTNPLRINNIPPNTQLFSYTTAHGFSSLTKSLFLQRCNEIWHPLGYPRTTGHCFRIGGTTELLIAGTPPDVVKATGRWSSDSFLRYWRSLDDIAPQYIRHIHTKKHRHKFR